MSERGSAGVVVAVLAALGIVGVLMMATCAGMGLVYRSQIGRAKEEAQAIAGRLATTPRGQSLPPSASSSSADYLEAVTSGSHDHSLASGDVVVRIKTVSRVQGPLETKTGEQPSNDEYLLIRLTLENTSLSSELIFQGWNRPNDPVGPYATLTDDAGNACKRIEGSSLVGMEPVQFIAPGQTVETALVFELPKATARVLKLTLPCKAIATEGELQFSIPAPVAMGDASSE